MTGGKVCPELDFGHFRNLANENNVLIFRLKLNNFKGLLVHPLSYCGIWHDGAPGVARGAVPPSAAPDEGMLVCVPVRGGTLDGFFDLGPGFEAAPFEG